MIEGIEALLALERTGTISEAAAQLRLTQSAVSKRIQALEIELKIKLTEPDGRRVRLTHKGYIFLDKARLVMLDLKNLKELESGDELTHFSIAMSDSVAASWGPQLLNAVTRELKTIDFEIHVHRSTLVEENIKLGRYHLGLCTSTLIDTQVTSELILDEPIVLLRCKPAHQKNILITIEKNSGSWKSLDEQILKYAKSKNYKLCHVESFAAIIQMAKEGYGDALVPLGLAQSMHVDKKDIIYLNSNLKRHVHLIARKGIAQLPSIIEFKKILKIKAQDLK